MKLEKFLIKKANPNYSDAEVDAYYNGYMNEIQDILDKLRWKDVGSQKSHAELLSEFYYYNKYYLTEQMKDCILDAIECLNAIHEIQWGGLEDSYIDNCILNKE